jgi:SAM-dependent methyltransferase
MRLHAGDPEYALVVRALRDGIIEHYHERGERLDTDSGLRTLDTNSTLAADRAGVLLEMLARGGGPSDLTGLRVADLGCGFGALSLCFAVAGAEVVGVDPKSGRSAVAAAIADELSLPASFQRGWLQGLVLPDESFDIAVLNNSLCYIVPREDRRRALEHTFRILAPGGWAVLRNPSRMAPSDPFTGMPLIHQLPPGLARRLTRRMASPRSHVRLRTATSLSLELRRAGFRSVQSHRVEKRWYPPRYQHHVARRPPASADIRRQPT